MNEKAKAFYRHGIDIGNNTGQKKFKCPKCHKERKNQRDPSLSVNIDEGVWTCWHCGWVAGIDSNKELGKIVKVDNTKFKVKEFRPAEVDPDAVAWFKSRGIGENTISDHDIGISEINNEKFVVFKYFLEGQDVNYKYRGIKNKTFSQSPGGKKTFYNLSHMYLRDDIETLIITEGELDVLSIWEVDMTNVVSVPNGAPSVGTKNYTKAFEYLEECLPKLENIKKFIIAVDNDPPGVQLSDELIRRLGPEKCLKVVWPEGCKDANDVLMKYDPETLRMCIEAAEEPPLPSHIKWDHASIMARKFKNEPPGLTTGYRNFDYNFKFIDGSLVVITGLPGHGKSEFINTMAFNALELHGYRTVMFSPEYPSDKLGVAFTKKKNKKGFAGYEKPFSDKIEDSESLEYLDKNVFYVSFEDTPSVDELLETVRAYIVRKGIKIFILDPWNELEHMLSKGESETNYISRSLTKIRKFARKYKIIVLLAAHPKKMHKYDNGEYEEPGAYDISGSANWYNKPDFIFTVYKNNNDRVNVTVSKVRDRDVANPGVSYFTFDTTTTLYHQQDMSHED